MEIEKIKELISAVSDSGLTDFDYEEGNMKIHLEKKKEQVQIQSVALSAAPEVKAVPAETVAEEATPEGFIVESPLVGTYYQAPSADAEPFVRVGDTVKKGDVLAIVEAMKLMNEIESEIDGTIAEIYLSDEDPVEYGQPLFRIV